MKNANCWFLGLVTWLSLYTSFKKFAVVHAAEEQTVTVNTAKWTQIISDRFLSITIDPEILLLEKDTLSDTTRILKLVRGLAPSYLRIGGPSTNQYYFGSILSGDNILNNTIITESQWVMFNNFAREAGFDVIVCLNALQRLNGIWDPRNALDLISFSDKMGYNIDWELGYELQKLEGKISAEQLAMDVNRLRNILNSFSHYKHSIIVGPDITSLYTKKDIDFLREFMHEAGSSLDAITWHPKYLSTSSYPITGEELDYMLERLIFEKEGLTKMLGRQIARKPIWIAESNNDTSHGYFIDALNWAQELGSFAGIGIQTVMKQPNLRELLEITPSYWVSLLHKALVGSVVLDVRHNSANNTNIPVFCHCTNTMKSNKASELITTYNKYEPGAITFFAVNRRSSEINLSVKLSSGVKQDSVELHQYLLSADHTLADPLLSRTTLLNGKQLSLEHTGDLPELLPHIKHTGWNLTVSLPPASVGFWVIPRASVKLCVSASKKAIPHRTDVQSQPLIKAVAVGSYVSSYGSRNSEGFGKDLKHSVNAGTSKNETYKEYHVDESKTRAFKNKKHHSLKNKKFLEKKTQEFKHLATADENETVSSHVSKNKEAYMDNENAQLSRIVVEELGLEAQGNYTQNISTEQKSPAGRIKRYAPEANNAISFSGIPIDIFSQSSLNGRPPKARRKKKAELKSDKKEDREQRKDKLKHKDDNIQATLFDPFFSSIENEEQYFHHMKGEDNEIQPFPSGDIYLKQGDSSEERRNNDYDYVDRDEKEFKEDEDEVDDVETADIDLSLKPGEFFETIRGTRDKINEHFVGYGGELWEAETFTLATPTDKMEDVADDEDAYDQEVIHESAPTEEEDRKRKAAAAKLLNSYLTEGYAEKHSEETKQKDKTFKKTRIQRKTERKQEYAQDDDDDNDYFITDHKDKTKKIPEKPAHHHHHHHHIIGHSKSAKEGKQNHYDHAHNIHNHKDRTRKLANHNEKHLFSEEDDIFFPHISHEKEIDYKRNHAYHRNLHSSEEKIEPMKNSLKGREKAAQTSQIKNDALLLHSEHFEGSSTSPKSPRQSRARKVSHRVEEGGSTNGKSKNVLKISENENDNNLSRMYEESSENRKVSDQNDKQQKNKNSKSSISTSSSDYTYKDKDIHNEKKKSKDKQRHSSNGHNKYETKDMDSEALDSRSIESNTKISKKKVQVIDVNDSFEDAESQMNSGEIIEEENEEHELDPNSAEHTDKRTTKVNPIKTNHKTVMRSSSENFEDIKVKNSKHKEKNTNHKTESVKINSSVVSLNNNEKVGHRKSKKIEKTSEDSTINSHMSRNSVSSRKPSQPNDYSNEESTEKTELASRPSLKTQDSKHKSEKGKKNKQRSQEISVEQENESTDLIEDSLEQSNKMEATSDAHENLSIVSSHSEIESKTEQISSEDISNEDISDQHSHNKQSQQKNLKISKSKHKTKAKHISEEHILEDNISEIEGELKKRHTSTEHYSEANKESELRSEVDKLEGESKHSAEVETVREKPRTPSDENNEKPSKEKDTKRKSGRHRTTKKNDHHNRARREIFAMLTNDNSNTSVNHSYGSENSNTEMLPNNKSELFPDTDLGLRENEMQDLIDSANTFIGNIVADDIGVNPEPNMFLLPQQYIDNNEYLPQDVMDHSSSHEDIVLEDMMQENTQSSKTVEYNPEDEHFSSSESQTKTWTFRSNNEYLPQDVMDHSSSHEDIVLEDMMQENTQSSKTVEYNPEDEHFSSSESQTKTWTFRSDNSVEVLTEQGAEPLVRENNAKREVDSKTFVNAVVQSILDKGTDNKEQILYKSSPHQENINSNQDEESIIMIKGDEESNRHALFQSPFDADKIHNNGYISENTYIQDKYSSESKRNRKDTSNEEKVFHLPEPSLKINHDMPIKASDDEFARNTLISKESDLQPLLEKNINELSKEELLYSKGKSNEMKQLNLDLKPGINQNIEEDELEDISMKSVAASEYVEPLPMHFITTDSTTSLHSEAQQNAEPLIKMFAAETEKEALDGDKRSDEHDNNKDRENNDSVESKYHSNISEDIQFERVPKAIMHVIENTSNMDKMEHNDFEGNHMLNQADETRNSDRGLEMISTAENTEQYNILNSSSKELKNSELLDGINTTLYNQGRSAQDATDGELVSVSSLIPETNHDNNASTKESPVTINDKAHNNEPSSMNANVSKEIVLSERSSSINDAKKIKTLKPLALPKKNTDRLKLEQKYKERIQQLKERRAKIKAGLFKKPDVIQFKKADNVSTNKKIRKRRAMDEKTADHKSSLQQLINDEDVSQQMNANIFDSSIDSQNKKSLSESAPLLVTKDYDTDKSSVQPYNIKFIQKVQHTAPHLWNTDILVTPSHIVTESVDIFDHYMPRAVEQRSTKISDIVSVPVTLHKTLLITENNPYYSDEEAVRDGSDQDVANNELISEEVFVKLTAPLINYEPLNNLQQETTYFHKFIPVHENDIDVLKVTYGDDFESGNTEVKEAVEMDRSPRYASFVIEGDTSFKNNFQSGSFAEPTDVKGYSNDNNIILKHLLHEHEQYKMDTLPVELNASPDNIQDALANYETNSNRFIESISSKAGRDTRKEAMITPTTNNIDTGLLFPTLEVITDMSASNDNDDVPVNDDTRSEDQIIFAVRTKRDLRTNYDPLNNDLLLPFIIPIIPENEKSLDAFLDKIDSQQFKEINNKIDSLQVVSSESDMEKELMNEHQTMNVNERSLTSQSILEKLLNSRNADDKILGSNSMNQINTIADDAKADTSLKKVNLFNILHPNSLAFHTLDFGKKEAGYNSKGNGLNVVVSDETFNEVESKPFYKHTDKYIIPINSKDRIKYLYPNVRNYSPVMKIVEEYVHTKESKPNTFSVDAESYSVLEDKKIVENNNSSDYDGEAISKEVLDMKTNLLNDSHSKHFNTPEEDHSDVLSSYLENNTNNAFNITSSSNFEGKHGNHTEDTLHPKAKVAVTTEGDPLVHNKSARASAKGKRENQKTAADSQLSTFHGILKTLTESVISFLHQLSPWKTSAD